MRGDVRGLDGQIPAAGQGLAGSVQRTCRDGLNTPIGLVINAVGYYSRPSHGRGGTSLPVPGAGWVSPSVSGAGCDEEQSPAAPGRGGDVAVPAAITA
jgi:hypothetical protein